MAKTQTARHDKDLLVKIEIRRLVDKPIDIDRDIDTYCYIAQEIEDLDSYAIHKITGDLAKATNEVANNRW